MLHCGEVGMLPLGASGTIFCGIFGAGLSILSMVVFGESAKTLANVDWIGIGSFASAFFVLRKLKWNPILTMCLCGVAGLGLHILLGI